MTRLVTQSDPMMVTSKVYTSDFKLVLLIDYLCLKNYIVVAGSSDTNPPQYCFDINHLVFIKTPFAA